MHSGNTTNHTIQQASTRGEYQSFANACDPSELLVALGSLPAPIACLTDRLHKIMPGMETILFSVRQKLAAEDLSSDTDLDSFASSWGHQGAVQRDRDEH